MGAHQALTAVVAGAVLSASMQTLLTNASPRIAAEMDADPWYSWISGSYLLASTMTIPVCAQWADRIGSRPVLRAGYAAYGVGTVLLALAPDIGTLITARSIQGLGAGAIMPATLAGIGLLFVADARARALAAVGVAQTAAHVTGLILSGWFVDGPGWRLGVLTTCPILLVSLMFTRHVPTMRRRDLWWHLDLHEPVRLLRQGMIFRLVILAASAGALTLSMLTYVPLLLQQVWGMSASASGGTLIAMLIATGTGTAATGHFSRHQWLQPFGWLLTIIGTPLILVPSLTTVGLALAGVGLGIVLPLLLLTVQRGADDGQLAQMSGLIHLSRTAGAAISVPVLGLWLVSSLPISAALTAVMLTISGVAAAGLLLSLVPAPEENT